MVIRAIATLAPWYKGILTDDTIPGLKKGTKVWFKLNTEKPLSSGPSYWVFDAKALVLRHISETLGNEILEGVREGRGWSVATEEQTEELKRRFKPLVTKVINSPSWRSVGKPRSGSDIHDMRPRQSFQR